MQIVTGNHKSGYKVTLGKAPYFKFDYDFRVKCENKNIYDVSKLSGLRNDTFRNMKHIFRLATKEEINKIKMKNCK